MATVQHFGKGLKQGPYEATQDELTLEIKDGIALLTLSAQEGDFPWKAKRAEHRWNFVTMTAINQALDAIEDAGDKVNVVVFTNEGKFWSNGADLMYMSNSTDKEGIKQHGKDLDAMLARMLTFPLPTVAAIRGHFCATGGMMGLAHDYRVMSNDRGVFFIPAVDLGSVYGHFATNLMKSKLDKHMQREVILFNRKRWVADEMVTHGAVDIACPSDQVLEKAMELAVSLKSKGQGAARKALGGIKHNVYKEVVEALGQGGGDKGVWQKGHAYAPPPSISKSKL